MFTEFDRLAMTRALALAERGFETTHPNPRVGCVIAKGERIIAEGWHERAGQAHAEVAALRAAKEPVAGATAYVTLEPCSHFGRTPPCVNALIEARIARVVFAVQDPNPRVSGQGADALLRAGIAVEAGLMEAEATEVNIGFMKRMKHGLPWVRVKLAMSLDGRTALANGASQWITGESARNDVQRWRARCSAVMTGVGTVLADDPQLNVRTAGFKGRQPLRVVLDSRLRSPPGAKMFVGLDAPAVGATGRAGSAVGGGAAGATGAAGMATGVVGSGVQAAGDVLIFAAAGGGIATASPALSAVLTDPADLAEDMAALVNAFETSPTAVAARSADVAGPPSAKISAKPDAPASPSGAAGALVLSGTSAMSNSTPAPGSAAASATAASVATPSAPVVAAATPVASGVPAPGLVTVSAGPGASASAAPTATPAAPVVATAAPASSGPATGPVTVSGPAASASAAPVATRPAAAAAAASGGSGTAPVTASDSAPPTLAAAPASAAPVATAAAPAAAAPTPASNVPNTPPAASKPGPAPVAAVPSGASASTGAIRPATGPSPTASAAATKTSPKVDSPAAFQARRAALAAHGVRIEEVPADDGFLDLFAVLQKLAELEVNEVLVEAGPTLAGQLLTTFFVDELLLYIAPKLLGPQGRPLVNLPELQSLQDAWGFGLFDAKRFGEDLRLRLRPK